MKNILMIATYFPPMSGIGTVRVTKYIKYLKKYGWKPTVITIDEQYITNRDDSLLNDIDDDIKIYKLKFKKRHKDISIDFYKELKRRIGLILKQNHYDMVFITGGPFMILPIGNYIYKKYKINYVIDLRDPWKLQKSNYNKHTVILSKLKKAIKGVLEKKSFKYAKKIFTVNDTMTNEYIEEYPEYRNRFVTIPNGYDMDDYINIDPKELKEFTIVYAGKFETAAGFRNPNILFKTIRRLNEEDYKIKFIHIGKEEKKVMQLMKNEGCQEYCEYVGLKKFNETIAYCKGADILIVICGSERNEQTGKIFDYICCERPIIVLANDGTEINNVCKNFKNIYNINLEDSEMLYNTIVSIYKGQNKLYANDLSSSEYNRAKLTKKLADALGSTIDEQKSDK